MTTNSTPERLARIETILERLEPKLDHVISEVDDAKRELIADKADLAALKNRGAGILIGIAVLASVIGAKLQAILNAASAAFK